MPASASPATHARRYSREQIIRLGQSGSPWQFLPVAHAALAVAPRDAGLRLLAAAHAARLGLVTLAREHLDNLPIDARDLPHASELRNALDTLPPDAWQPDPDVPPLQPNLAALSRRGIDLTASLQPWTEHARRFEWFRAADGHVIRRPAGARAHERWLWLADHQSAARAFVTRHLQLSTAQHCPPITLQGACPPWLFRAIYQATADRADGYAPRIALLQADPIELLDGLAVDNLAHMLDDQRVLLFVGPDAATAWADDLARRFHTQIVGPLIHLPTLRTRASPELEPLLRTAQTRQLEEHARLADQVRRIYAPRDAAWWRRRYASAGTDQPPLRVLIPTCRYSTFVQHAAADLADAFLAAGADVRTIIEPDAHSRLSSLAYLRPLAHWQPDLVVLINYTRANMGELFPPQLPFVCWIQDAMPHLFDQAIGRAQGDMDFLVGHLFPELFSTFGYPRRRTLSAPVVASARKFHPGPVPHHLADRCRCTVAYVSHHAETPDALHARLRAEAASSPAAHAMDLLRPRIHDVLADAVRLAPAHRLLEATRLVVTQTIGPDDRLTWLLYNQYTRPMAERIFRHQTLAWVADAADRRGWSFKLFGRGWDRHPHLARFAAGELEHGEALRACYQLATVHLHASIHTLTHQRVLECALAGGLPICRFHRGALSLARGALVRTLVRERSPQACLIDRRLLGFRVADHPDALAYTALLQRLGADHDAFIWVRPQAVESGGGRDIPPELRPDWLLGDLAETTFSDQPGLERLVERAITRPAWRSATSAMIARRVRERATHQALVPRILDLVRTALADS